MAKVWISVPELGDVVRGLERGIETLRHSRDSLRTTLDRHDLETWRTSAINPAVDWAVDELPGVRRRLALAEVLEGTDPTWPPGRIELDESTVSTVPPELAVKQGEEVAAALRDGEGRPDDALIEEIRAGMEDPYFASGFASQLTAKELAALVTRLSTERTLPGGGTSEEEAAAENAWYNRLVVGLAHTVGTATRATGELAVPPGYARSWVDEMTQEVDQYFYPESTGTRDHANALSLLVTSGTWDATFLTTVAGGVLDYEQAYTGGPREELWLNRGPWDPMTGETVFDAAGKQVRDPVEALLAGLGNNAEASQAFFQGGGTATLTVDGVDVPVSDRLRYLVQERTWNYERVPGRSLGAALESATTELRNRDESGRASAEIAAQAVAVLGQWTGHGAHGAVGPKGIVSPADAGWEMPEGMRQSVARMLASYGADVHRITIPGNDVDDIPRDGWSMEGSGSLFPADMPYGARMDLANVEKLVRTLGQDTDDFAPFLAGVYQAGNLRIDTALKAAMEQQTLTNAGGLLLTDPNLDHATNAFTHSAQSVAWALETGLAGDVADADLAKKRAEASAEALSLIAGMPFVPDIKPEWVAWGVDQAKDQLLDGLKESPGAATADYAALDDRARQQLRDTAANLLLRNGYLSEEAVAAAAANNQVVTPPPPEAILTGADGSQVFDTSSPAYREWIVDSEVAAFIEGAVVNPYASAWGSVR